MDASEWPRARLIPTSGIRGADEQEVRATSALLAVMTIIPDFARSLLSEVGAPAGRVAAFTETTFDDADGRTLRPDGVLQVERGKTRWAAIIEVKTGKSRLGRDQVKAYARLANREGIDAVITISNTFVAPSAPHPVQLPQKVLKKVELFHWSWTHVLTRAVILRERHQVQDREQAWILDELIKYLEDDRSGALDSEGLGPHWVAVRDAARAGTLRSTESGLDDIVLRWDQFLRYLCLHLGRDLGTDVDLVVSREHQSDPAKRSRDMLAKLADEQLLEGTLRIPNAAGDIYLTADLRARRVRAALDLRAPATQKATTRVKWLVRQLSVAPDTAQLSAYFGRGKSTSDFLDQVRIDPKVLLLPGDSRREPRRFTVALERDMGIKGGRGRGTFIGVIEDLTRDFYHDVVQNLTPWVERAPKLRQEPQSEASAGNVRADSSGPPESPPSSAEGEQRQALPSGTRSGPIGPSVLPAVRVPLPRTGEIAPATDSAPFTPRGGSQYPPD